MAIAKRLAGAAAAFALASAAVLHAPAHAEPQDDTLDLGIGLNLLPPVLLTLVVALISKNGKRQTPVSP